MMKALTQREYADFTSQKQQKKIPDNGGEMKIKDIIIQIFLQTLSAFPWKMSSSIILRTHTVGRLKNDDSLIICFNRCDAEIKQNGRTISSSGSTFIDVIGKKKQQSKANFE